MPSAASSVASISQKVMIMLGIVAIYNWTKDMCSKPEASTSEEPTMTMDPEVEQQMRCEKTNEFMREPYMVKGCEHTFERWVIQEIISQSGECPKCGQKTSLDNLTENKFIKEMIALHRGTQGSEEVDFSKKVR